MASYNPIRPPFRECPKCKESDGFGFYKMDYTNYSPQTYTMRCRYCGAEHLDFLEKLNRKIIYLDQYVLSEMLKAVDPHVGNGKKIDPCWMDLLERLARLVRMQLIVCPVSDILKTESLFVPFSPELKTLFQYLAQDIEFASVRYIQESQIYEHATLWIQGNGDQEPVIPRDEMLEQEQDGWEQFHNLHQNYTSHPAIVDEATRSKQSIDAGLLEVADGWKSEPNKNRDTWYKELVKVFGLWTLERRLPFSSDTIGAVRRALEKQGIPKADLDKKTKAYFQSPELENIPFLKISALLLAAESRKYAGGATKIQASMAYDFNAIAAHLPYSDVIIVDRRNDSHFNGKLLRETTRYGTQVFSKRNLPDLFQYLDNLEQTAPPALKNHTQDIYNWQKPFYKLYQEHLDRKQRQH